MLKNVSNTYPYAPDTHFQQWPPEPLAGEPGNASRFVPASGTTEPLLPAKTHLPEAVHLALRDALRTIRSWRPPPNWSRADWAEERIQVACWAAFQAMEEYNPARSPFPLQDFIRYRILARVLTHYRREWSFSARFLPHLAQNDHDDVRLETPDAAASPAPEPSTEANPASAVSELREAVLLLEAPGHWVLMQIFWHGYTESELAAQLGLSQRAVSKRKQTALKQLLLNLKY